MGKKQYIQPRGKHAAISVALTDKNLEILRAIPSEFKFSGSTCVFQPTAASIAYVRKHFPKLPGLDQFNHDLIAAPTAVVKKGKWELGWEPYDHQKACIKASWNRPAFAWFLDMGTGKSAITILNAAWLAWKGLIDGLLIAAPAGVHRKWIDEEFPQRWPACIEARAVAWSASMRKAERDEFESALQYPGFVVLAINIEAFSASKRAEALAKGFVSTRRVMMALDESHLIKSPGAKRSRAIKRLGKQAHFRRILTGTPGQPIDYYSQFEFLNKDILGFHTYTAFRAYFATLIGLPDKDQQAFEDDEGRPIVTDDQGRIVNADGTKGDFLRNDRGRIVITNQHGQPLKKDRTGRAIRIIATDKKTGKKKYKNIERLKRLVGPYVFRVTKDECLDLPPKVYERIPCELTKKQRKIYNDLRDDLIVDFQGRDIVASMAIQKLLRLRQVIGGFLPDEDGHVIAIDKTNPRIEALISTVVGIEHKVIVWASFKAEIEAIRSRIAAEDLSVVTYYGEDTARAKRSAKDAFQNGDVQFFVSNPQCGGVGLDLYASHVSIFYSNSYSLKDRMQAEDRTRRIGQTADRCVYGDLFAYDTIDQMIVRALIAKREIETELTGDEIVQWLQL